MHDVIFELWEPLQRFLQKNSHHWQHISVAQDGFQNFMYDIYSLFNKLKSVTSEEYDIYRQVVR